LPRDPIHKPRHRRLGERLRALILATPLIGGVACGNKQLFYCPPAPNETATFGLTHYDDGGALYFPTPPNNPAIAVPLLPDGGLDCESPCSQWGEQTQVDRGDFTPGLLLTCSVASSPDAGLPEVDCTFEGYRCIGGRRPPTLLASPTARRPSCVGAYFAQVARLEAASIPAFHIAANELRAHRAPARLVASALRSAQDEVRHTRATSMLARRYGAKPIRPVFGATPTERSLEAIATENAVEGCVRETYGALVALWQARHAKDPVVASAMGPIAADETRHAELSWEIAAWVEPRLSRAARSRINAAREQALADLATESSRPLARSLVLLAGLPPPESATALLNRLGAELRMA
jgi:hypothetical protein